MSAGLRIAFFGRSATLTLGVGPDYGICDVYVDGMLWRGFDNYAASAGEDAISLALQGDGPHILEVKNRAEKSRSSSGYKVAFKQMVVAREYDLHTIQYGYDGLSRLQSADYYASGNTNGTPFKTYAYGFDLAGNRTLKDIDGTQTTYTYNAANQITNSGFAYDDAGRMTSDGVNTYTWDRATRLLSMGGISYAYDGLGDRISQTANSVVTNYLNDIQPGLTKVLSETTGSNTTRFIHGPRGIQAVEDSVGAWTFPVQDGLGSVRDDALSYSPYGVPDDTITGFAFTGEMCDANGLQYHRARYYAPELGVFPSVDPFENVNRYGYVGNNPTNYLDPSGLQAGTGAVAAACALAPEICLALGAAVLLTGAAIYTNSSIELPAIQLPQINMPFSPADPLDLIGPSFRDASLPISAQIQNYVNAVCGSSPPGQLRADCEAGQYRNLNMPYTVEGTTVWPDFGRPRTDEEERLPVPPIPPAPGLSDIPWDELIDQCGDALERILHRITGNRARLSDQSADRTDDTDDTTALFHYGTQGKISFILTTQTIPFSDETINPKRARYGNGVYFTELGPYTLTKAQLARKLYGNPFPSTQRSVEAWVYIDLSKIPLSIERQHVFRVPTTAPLSVVGRIMASGITP